MRVDREMFSKGRPFLCEFLAEQENSKSLESTFYKRNHRAEHVGSENWKEELAPNLAGLAQTRLRTEDMS